MASMEKPIPESNKGHQMLLRMGWKGVGSGLGECLGGRGGEGWGWAGRALGRFVGVGDCVRELASERVSDIVCVCVCV